ncbi:MAG: DUF835 domain-containing protein, partial [Thermoplasmata archaeon]|nr:DUF835 domain-containing protein [Thermoplasmata archaeon]
HAPFPDLAAVPGFGPFVAAELVGAFGGEVPPVPPHHRPVIHREGESVSPVPPLPPETRAEPPPIEPSPAAPLPETPPAPVRDPTPPPAPSVPLAPPPAPVPLAPPQLIVARETRPPVAPAPPIELVALSEAPPTPTAPPSGVRLSLGDREEPAWRRFLDATSAGHRGLCLSREFPERRRALLGPRDVEVVWLSNVGKGNAIRPGDLPALTAVLSKALTENGVTAVFVEGGEYLVRIHGVTAIAAVLRQLNDLAVERGARLWLPINPALMPAGDVEALAAAVPTEPIATE